MQQQRVARLQQAGAAMVRSILRGLRAGLASELLRTAGKQSAGVSENAGDAARLRNGLILQRHDHAKLAAFGKSQGISGAAGIA